LIIASHNPASVKAELEGLGYLLKGGEEPKNFLGASLGKHTFADGDTTWYQSAEEYLTNAVKAVEEKVGRKLEGGKRKHQTPLDQSYRPEVDLSPLLEEDRASYYQSMIGILMWAVELGRIDIAQETVTMARFTNLPRSRHWEATLGIFAYLKKHIRSRLVFDDMPRDFGDINFIKADWGDMYPGAKEDVDDNNPRPMGREVQTTVFVDASHADCLVTRRSTTGILVFVNGTPIRWYSKRQNTVESSTYGSEFVAMRIAVEMIIALRGNLRSLGVPLDGPTNLFCDNLSVVMSTSLPESVLKKKHIRSRLVFDDMPRDFGEINFIRADWGDMYPGAKEDIDDKNPRPMGREVQTTVFNDASHVDCLATRRSTTGILVIVNGTPIRWYSKRQNTVESSTYGSEFVAMRIAVEMIIALRGNLRSLGVPLDGPTNLFCDNLSVVMSTSLPESVLKKKHNAIAYHKVRETIASGAVRAAHEPTGSNLADLLSKQLPGPTHKHLVSHILY
jgi:hypothetical protein